MGIWIFMLKYIEKRESFHLRSRLVEEGKIYVTSVINKKSYLGGEQNRKIHEMDYSFIYIGNCRANSSIFRGRYSKSNR